LVDGILGDDERPEAEAPDSLARAEAFAAAVAAIASRQDPGVARKTEEFLSDQSRLLRLQAEHLKDEHALRLASLRGQKREGALRRTGMRIRIAFQLFAATVAAVIGGGVILVLHDAFTSRRVVIEPFHTPPDLAAHGIDGTVVAGGLLDQLSHLQYSTRSSSAALGMSGAWSGNIKLDVPETGISIDEISRLLRERFGHDVHIDGDLIEKPPGGLALTVRGNGVLPKTFEGAATELEKLTVEAAEYVFLQSQPARWGTYLSNMGRDAEAIEFCRTTIAAQDPETRARLLNVWGVAIQNVGGSPNEALAFFQSAVKIKPDFWVAYTNVINAYMILGQEEEAWHIGETMRAVAGGRPGSATEVYYENWDLLTWNVRPWLAALIADAAATGGGGTGATAAGPAMADVYVREHDADDAELAIKTTKEDPHDPSVAAVAHFIRGRLAAESGNHTAAVAELEAFEATYTNPIVFSNYAGYICWLAPAEEAAGHPDKADAVLKSSGTFVDCYRFRADIVDHRGDWPGAQKAYSEAVALAPDLPAAYYSWGLALVRHGELDSAIEKLKAANERGPHWADPLKAWGDVLAKQGHTRDALAKYQEALKYAPNWNDLKEARAVVAKQKS
jgi:tetratricopeptide (TPR) repeat protein